MATWTKWHCALASNVHSSMFLKGTCRVALRVERIFDLALTFSCVENGKLCGDLSVKLAYSALQNVDIRLEKLFDGPGAANNSKRWRCAYRLRFHSILFNILNVLVPTTKLAKAFGRFNWFSRKEEGNGERSQLSAESFPILSSTTFMKFCLHSIFLFFSFQVSVYIHDFLWANGKFGNSQEKKRIEWVINLLGKTYSHRNRLVSFVLRMKRDAEANRIF